MNEHDKRLIVDASQRMELETTPYGYALICAGLSKLKKDPDIPHDVYKDTKRLIESLEAGVNKPQQDAADSALERIDTLPFRPVVDPDDDLGDGGE